MKSKITKKIKRKLFPKVGSGPRGIEMKLLFLAFAMIFGIAFLNSGYILSDHIQKKESGAPNSRAQMQIVKSAVAAESQTEENAPAIDGNVPLNESKNPWTLFVEVDPTKDNAPVKTQTKKRIVSQHTLQIAQINNAPVLAGHTKKLPDGKRLCPVKSEHPQRGGRTHIDEDCCADYNEYPNPRCYYSPEEMAILKKR